MSYVGCGSLTGHGEWGRWGWIVPDDLWEPVEPLLPCERVRPQGGGTRNTPDEAVFAAIAYVLNSGCAWRHLPLCFGIPGSTAHRRFPIRPRAGMWARLHRAVLDQLAAAELLDLPRVLIDTARARVKKGGEHPGPSPVDGGRAGSKMHVLSDANGLPLMVTVPRGATPATARD
ncbi:hypothetical protein GCM10027160_26540 [Streptomyces calidiresistens]